MVLNRPLVIAIALVAASLAASILSVVFDAPMIAATLAAATSPGILVTLYEVLRVLDDRVDDTTRRSAFAALALLLVPLAVLFATAARLGVRVSWRPQ